MGMRLAVYKYINSFVDKPVPLALVSDYTTNYSITTTTTTTAIIIMILII